LAEPYLAGELGDPLAINDQNFILSYDKRKL
jgi:hypothetical protein